MTEQTTSTSSSVANRTNSGTVEAFLFALRDQDYDAADALLADDLVYENVGLPTLRGRVRVMKLFRSLQGRMDFDVKFHRIAEEDIVVLNERTDALVFGPLRVQFWVCGVFEVHDGRITLWRDYFDTFDFIKATLRGIVAIAVPSLRPRM